MALVWVIGTVAVSACASIQTRPPVLRKPAVDMIWPVAPQVLTSTFGYRKDPIARRRVRFHPGIDLGGRHGMKVVAAADGHVVKTGWAGGYGRRIVIQHRNGMRTSYAHLKRVMVRRGQRVEQGQPIGLMGSSGRTTGPHLHFEVRKRNVPIDPLKLLLRGPKTRNPPLQLARRR